MTPEPEQLPCGVGLEPLVVQVAEGRPPADAAHQGRCPYCQAALRSLAGGWCDLQALTREPVAVPADLTARIMARVRMLTSKVASAILLGSPRGETLISHRVVDRVTQRLAGAVPGVVFASARTVALEPPEPGRLSVALRLVVAFGPTVDGLGQAVRELLARRVPALTGAELSRIDITVEDIADPPG